jgi:hypothetical protein
MKKHSTLSPESLVARAVGGRPFMSRYTAEDYRMAAEALCSMPRRYSRAREEALHMAIDALCEKADRLR